MEPETGGARGSRGTSRTRSEPGPCPNLPQRPQSSRGAQEESLMFRGFLRDLSRPGAPLWQIWTRSRPGSSQNNLPGTVTPRTVTPRTVTPRTVTPRTVTPGPPPRDPSLLYCAWIKPNKTSHEPFLPGRLLRRCLHDAGGTPVATWGEGVSKSATKALRGGIGREEKRGISTILLARLGSIGAFVADFDNPRRRGPLGGAPRASRRPGRASPDVETCTLHSKVQLQPSFSSAKCTFRRGGNWSWP